MNALVRAEARKLVSTRTFGWVAAAVLAYPALGAAAVVLAPERPEAGPDALLQFVRGASGVVELAVLVLGIVAAAGEYRHGTIVPTLLAAPGRGRLVVAKMATLAGAAAALALATGTVAMAAGAAGLAQRGLPGSVTGDVALTVAAMALVAAVYATAGVAVGAVVRNQTAAVTGALVWVLAVENAVPVVLRDPGLRYWMPGGATDRLLQLAGPAADGPSLAAALAGAAALAAGGALAAVAVTRRVDVA